jgi:hypothetical protein
MRSIAVLAGVLGSLVLPAGALAHPEHGHPRTSTDPVVVRWNQELLAIVRTPGAQPPTIHPTRNFAIVHEAIEDAVGAGRRGTPHDADPAAAADAAAHDTLAALYPSQSVEVDARLAAELGRLPSGHRTDAGLAVGAVAARRVLAQRADDGSGAVPPPYVTTGEPGDFRPAPPNFPAPVFTHWSGVTPFALRSASQFRPTPPPALGSAAYAEALNQVKELGSATSATRTADQTLAARFWNAPIQNYWNEIAQSAAIARGLDIAQQARLFATLDVAFADATIAFYDAKYAYRVWRPITAIREAGSDGNPATGADPAWTPLSNTPADPSYPGAHSVISAAGATVLDRLLHGDRFDLTVTSELLPGVTRSFPGFRAAEDEAGLSRIYAGVHTSPDDVAGRRLGADVARWILGHS